MKVGSSRILFIYVYVFISTSEGVQDAKALDIVDGLLASLSHEGWSQEELPCLQTTTALLKGVKNHTLWATWAWNSMQMPAGTFYGSEYHLGNFDQCLQVPWSSNREIQMQYRLVDVKLADLWKYDGDVKDPYVTAESFISKKSRYGGRFNKISLGVCLPSVCEAASVAKISRHLYQMSYLPFEYFNVNPLDCQTVEQKADGSIVFNLFWCFILVLSSVVIVVYFLGWKESDTTMSKVFKSFSISRNYEALFVTGKDEVLMMHGIRALTSGGLIVLHYAWFANVVIINYSDLEKVIQYGSGSYFMHLDVCVETFFVMSGIFHIRGLVASRTNRVIMFLFKRYLRLLFMLTLAVVTFVHVYPHLGSGPMWPRMVRLLRDPCVRNWWRNLLMISQRDDQGEHCIPVSWYIYCDYKLTVIGTWIFLLCKSNRRRGLICFFLAFILSVIIPASITYKYNLPSIFYYDVGESQILNENKVHQKLYIMTYARATSYIIGMAMGYLMTVYKPQNYRKTIPKAKSIMLFVIGFSLMPLVLHIGAYSIYKGYSALESSIYAILDKILWSFGICMIITVCEYGNLPIINNLLSSKVFVPFSKLSYLNYMVHSILIYRNIYSIRAPLTFDFFQTMTHGFGYICMSTMISYVLWFVIEAPMTHLFNILFENRKSPKSCQNVEVENSVQN